MKFPIERCPRCGRVKELMISNNPLSAGAICFDCINEQLDYNNLEHAEFFCRTYNLPWQPETWMSLASEYEDATFREYTLGVLQLKENQPNLAYESSTRDLWSRTNKEWEKCRSWTQVLNKLTTIKESYIERGRLKWGEQYTFEELIKLDSIYSRTLKANNITNPLQKESVKTLCKLQIEMDEAIRAKDAKAIKDYSNAWSTFAKQADLETMINETKTEDITTVAELYDFMERSGYKFRYYDGAVRDEADAAIKDIQDTNRRLILESTGLQQLLEEMIRQRKETAEEEHTAEVVNNETLEDLMNIKTEVDIEHEDDSDAESLEFEPDAAKQAIKVQMLDDKVN